MEVFHIQSAPQSLIWLCKQHDFRLSANLFVVCTVGALYLGASLPLLTVACAGMVFISLYWHCLNLRAKHWLNQLFCTLWLVCYSPWSRCVGNGTAARYRRAIALPPECFVRVISATFYFLTLCTRVIVRQVLWNFCIYIQRFAMESIALLSPCCCHVN